MQRALPTRRLGPTGLDVSVLGYGGSALGGVFQDVDDEAGIRSVHEAFKLGINYFDTSPYYGNYRAEQVLGRALADLPRSEIVVATKVGRYYPDKHDFSAENVTSSVHESMKRLNVQYLDVVQCHDIEFVDLNKVISDALPALQKLKKDGLVGHIGITGLPLKIFPSVLDRVEPGTVDLVLSYCHHTLFDNSMLAMLPYLKKMNVGILNASPMSMGLLSPRGPQPWHPAPQLLKDKCREAVDACARRGVSLPKLALMEAVKHVDISTTLVSMPSVEEVRWNVAAVKEALQVQVRSKEAEAAEDECLAEVRDVLKPVMNMTWPSGLPENN